MTESLAFRPSTTTVPRPCSRDGEIVAAAQEERFRAEARCRLSRARRSRTACARRDRPRGRGDGRLLRQAVPQVRAAAGDLSRDRAARLRLVPPRRCRSGCARSCSRSNSCCKRAEGPRARRHRSARLLFSEHHLSHAASAFYPSPFEEAAVLTMDGVGEWATTSRATARATRWRCCRRSIPPLAGPAVFGLHLLYRLPGQFRRVQADGAGALWRAEIRAS